MMKTIKHRMTRTRLDLARLYVRQNCYPNGFPKDLVEPDLAYEISEALARAYVAHSEATEEMIEAREAARAFEVQLQKVLGVREPVEAQATAARAREDRPDEGR